MRVLPPINENLSVWGENLRRYLSQALNQLDSVEDYTAASEDGILVFNRTFKYPVVSCNNSFKEVVLKQAVPSSSVGSSGDIAGMISWDTAYIYICTAAHDGSSNIWKRVALTGGSW